jgi:quercetin dioxygenase-like cupin family protein
MIAAFPAEEQLARVAGSVARMRLVPFGVEQGRGIDAFGSVAVVHTRLAAVRGEAVIGVFRLGPGGVIGRHPAASTQLLAVVAGAGLVSGADGLERPIGPGLAAVWEAGEEHATRTDSGLVAVVVEGPWLDLPGGE